MEEKSNENGSITVNLYGIKAEYSVQDAEAGKIKKIMDMLQIQGNFKELSAADALRKTRIAGLGERVAEAFDKTVKKEKRDALIGLAASVAAYSMARYFDMDPFVEKITHILGIIGMIGNPLCYARASIAGFMANSYLKGDL